MENPSDHDLLSKAGLVLAGLTLGSVLLNQSPARISQRRRVRSVPAGQRRRPRTPATVTAARRLNRAAGILATSVLADSGVEHYRGSFKNKAMFTPLVVSALTLATSIHGTADMRPVAHRLRDATYLLAAATGLVGTGFHIYNVGKKVGSFSWQNLFYGAPLGAPMAILLSGLVGFCSERVRKSEPGTRPGHEFVGTVVAAGDGVQRYAVGDRVLVSGVVGCGSCAPCLRGYVVGCTGGGLAVFGTTPAFPGGQAELVEVPNIDRFAHAERLDLRGDLVHHFRHVGELRRRRLGGGFAQRERGHFD